MCIPPPRPVHFASVPPLRCQLWFLVSQGSGPTTTRNWLRGGWGWDGVGWAFISVGHKSVGVAGQPLLHSQNPARNHKTGAAKAKDKFSTLEVDGQHVGPFLTPSTPIVCRGFHDAQGAPILQPPVPPEGGGRLWSTPRGVTEAYSSVHAVVACHNIPLSHSFSRVMFVASILARAIAPSSPISLSTMVRGIGVRSVLAHGTASACS